MAAYRRSLFRLLKPSAATAENLSEGTDAGSFTELHLGHRDWEDYYRRRWQHDKVVRSTHGCNCTGSCSWHVFVKDGIVAWDALAVDYPEAGGEAPDYEPRGCPRGASTSWYIYSPVRIKYPYVRSALLRLWREALAVNSDPVLAWRSIVEDPQRRAAYVTARGKGGLVRSSWDEAGTIVAASLVYTIKKYGPDRIFGFTPIPGMSQVGFAAGTRFLTLLGAPILSFYDWYADLPPASPQIWGDQTDVPVSSDWFNATYMIVWGTNLPQTRSADAHFYAEARYRGAKVTAVAPDYSEYVKFADTWLPCDAGHDGALAMAMTFVVLKEFYLDRQVPRFIEYVKTYTDLPFAVVLKRAGDAYISDRFLRASDLGIKTENAECKLAVFDTRRSKFVVPNGTIGSRWDKGNKWNLKLEDSISGSVIEPELSCADSAEWVPVSFPVFHEETPRTKLGAVPVRRVSAKGGELLVTTVFDLLMANVGLDRRPKLSEAARRALEAPEFENVAWVSDYDDPRPFTPAWQEPIAGVRRADAIRVAREFADNAERTNGRSMIFLGSGSNHWFNSDSTYRTILNLVHLCACEGVNGGGWAHYVGQERVWPYGGWSTLATAADWVAAPRGQNGTSFYYFASDIWRYENIPPQALMPPTYAAEAKAHIADYNVVAARLGWMPFYPQFDRNSLDLCDEAIAAGAKTSEEIAAYAVELLKSGRMKMAAEDPDAPQNVPRVLLMWRANVLGASAKGHEYFLKHLLGAQNAVLQPEHAAMRPRELAVREPAPEGKLDLLVTSDFRMTTSTLYSDVILPAATWYEMHDINTTDLHPFVHPFTAAVDPLWESKTNWDTFKKLAELFAALAVKHLGTRKDLVARPMMHDLENEIAQPSGKVRDWRKGEVEPVPGKTMPSLEVVTRDYANVHLMQTALGPRLLKEGVHAKGVKWDVSAQYEELKTRLGVAARTGLTAGMPYLASDRAAVETILALSPETDGRASVSAWKNLGEKTGLPLARFGAPNESQRTTFGDINGRPRRVMHSPVWTGFVSNQRSYAPFTVNIEERVPFRTLSGRAHFYLDHQWMLEFGDALPTYRPPLNLATLGVADVPGVAKDRPEIVLRYLTPHSKWSINSTFADTDIMTTLFRGGQAVWINDEDAAAVGVSDADWVECFNVNGLVLARAIVSPRITRGKAFMYHAQERYLNVPISSLTNQRAGTHNSVTRIYIKPTQLIGAYAQLSFYPNYYGPIGCQRDEVIVLRKAREVVFDER
jgi:nitrate reductase alpha subunit